MRPLTYLLLTKFKNQIKSFFKSPAKIIYLAVILLLIGVTLIGGTSGDRNTGRKIRALSELSAIITAFYSIMFVMLSNNGFRNGASMFSMADVNILFPAPFHQQRVLFYGLFQQLGTSLLLGVFLLFQYSWLHTVYNITYGSLLIILLGYALTVFFGQITAMVIYAFTSADDKRRRAVKLAYYAVIAAFLLYVAVQCIGNPSQILASAAEAANSAFIKLFPVSGWTGRAVSGILLGNSADIILGFTLCAAFLILLVCLITYGKQDYYEDVLKSSEIAQSAITARKEGKIGDASPRNVKIGKTGLGKGFGANAIYYKHKLENRRSRTLILDTMSLVFAVITIVMSLFMKSAGITAVFITATSLQIFSVALGRFNKELLKPYIYMIPEPPLKKMLFGLAESFPSAIAEAVLIFVPVAFILGQSPAAAVVCIIARISYTFLFTAVNIAVDRLWGGGSNKTFVMLLYFAILILLAAPGVILAIVIAAMNPGVGIITVFLTLVVCNIPISVFALFLSRNMLQYAELNQR